LGSLGENSAPMRMSSVSKKKPTEPSNENTGKWRNAEDICSLLHRLGDCAWIHNFSTHETLFSTDSNPLMGYSTAAALKQKNGFTIWQESALPEYQHLLTESEQQYQNSTHDHHCFEYKIKDREGKIHWILVRGVLVEKDEQGKPLVVAGIHSNITEIKELKIKQEEIEHARKKEVVDSIIRNMEADRGYVARELHNNINQILSAARMMLELIPMVNEEMGEYTRKVKYIIYNAVDEVNRICNLINPNSLDHISLPDLLKDQVNRAAKDKNIKIKLDINGFLGGKRFPRESELTMLRVIQDIVHRITNHSHATEASILLTQEKDFLWLEVFFNDPKFDLNRTLKNLRLVNLVNRCEHYGGSYSMKKEKGMGIYLNASVKIHGNTP
jgi:PAS domain S-box-containing protein